jgi:hypothetical protein
VDKIGSTTNKTGGTVPKSPSGPTGIQVTESENHPGWNKRKLGAAIGDVGGNFYTVKQYASCEGRIVSWRSNAIIGGFIDRSVTYDGFLLPYPLPVAFPPDASSSDGALNAYGTKAISAVKPTNALVDLSTALGELVKDGAPNKIGAELWRAGTAKALSHALGNEYLNVEFGWKPLVGDIRNTMNAIIQADTVMRQYERDAGRLVRRRYDFPSEHSKVETVSHDRVNAFTGYDDSSLRTSASLQGRVLRTRETSIKRWFSGGFTYHLPFGADGRVPVNQARKVYGLSLKPSTLWNLAPWSWAVDWFVPIGDLIGNLEDWASDGLVLRYGYIMEHSIVRDTYTFDGPTGFLASDRPSQIFQTTEVKKRRQASPFGFGLPWSGLTPRQLAIAAALGLSKS